MSDAATLTLPSPDHLWSLEEQVLALQQVAFRLFAADNWIWAAKMLLRVERVARRLEPAKNPFEKAGRPFTAAARRRAESRPEGDPGPGADPEPGPDAEPPPPRTEEEAYAAFRAEFERANEVRVNAELPPMTFEAALKWLARRRGQELADCLAAVHARVTAGPSG